MLSFWHSGYLHWLYMYMYLKPEKIWTPENIGDLTDLSEPTLTESL